MKKTKKNRKILIEGGGLLFLVPVLSVIGLALVMALTFWLIYKSELRQQKSTILQDVENSAQEILEDEKLIKESLKDILKISLPLVQRFYF